MDTNKDGSVDRKELVAWLQSDACKWTKQDTEDIKAVLKQTNESGATWQETKAGMMLIDKQGRIVSSKRYGVFTRAGCDPEYDSPYGCY